MGDDQHGPGALFERERELASLDALVRGAAAGDARLALIEGPAGVGKSRLLAELRRRAAGQGMAVSSARGNAYRKLGIRSRRELPRVLEVGA